MVLHNVGFLNFVALLLTKIVLNSYKFLLILNLCFESFLWRKSYLKSMFQKVRLNNSLAYWWTWLLSNVLLTGCTGPRNTEFLALLMWWKGTGLRQSKNTCISMCSYCYSCKEQQLQLWNTLLLTQIKVVEQCT